MKTTSRIILLAVVFASACRTSLEDAADNLVAMHTPGIMPAGICQLVVTGQDTVKGADEMFAARSKTGAFMVMPNNSTVINTTPLRKRAYAADGTPLPVSNYRDDALPTDAYNVRSLVGTDNGFLVVTKANESQNWLSRYDVSGKTDTASLVVGPKSAYVGTSDGTEWVAGTTYDGSASFWFDSVDQNAELEDRYKEFLTESPGATPFLVAKAGNFLAIASHQSNPRDKLDHLILFIQDVTAQTLLVRPNSVEIATGASTANTGSVPTLIRIIPIAVGSSGAFILVWRDENKQEYLAGVSHLGVVFKSYGPFNWSISDLRLIGFTGVSTTINAVDNTIVVTADPSLQNISLVVDAGGTVQEKAEIVMNDNLDDGRFAITWTALAKNDASPTGHIVFLSYAGCN